MSTKIQKLAPYFLIIFIPALSLLFIAKLTSEPTEATAYKSAVDDHGVNVTLPKSWVGRGASHTKGFNFKLDVSSKNNFIEQQYLLLNAVGYKIEVFFNDTEITNTADSIPWRGPLSTASLLITLPASMLGAKQSNIYINVFTRSDRKGVLSPIYIGTAEALSRHFKYRKFAENHLKIIIFSLQIVLVICCLTLFIARPKDIQFVYLGGCLAISSFFSLGIFSDLLEASIIIMEWSLLLVPASAILFLGFALKIEGLGYQRTAFSVAAIITTLLYGLSLINMLDMLWLVTHVAMPIGVVALLLAFIVVIYKFFANPTGDRAFICSGLALLIGSLIYDTMLQARIVEGSVLVAQYAWLFTLLAIIIFFMLHLSRLAYELDDAAVTLSAKLQQREAELSDIFAREKDVSNQLAVESQRAHIMTELHDGVAGSLSTIVALTDLDDPKPKEIHAVARYALSELRTVINALDLPEGSLLTALASIRETLVGPLERLGIDVQWSFIDFPDVDWLSSEQVLSVIRIIQEATNNAVQHGQPRKLLIEGKNYDDDMCPLCQDSWHHL